MIDLRIEFEGMDDVLARVDPERVPVALRAMVTGLARILLRYAQQDSPVRTGNLRRAGFMQVEGDGQSSIVAFATKYAGVVEGGSVAHEIMARNARTLAFVPTSYSSLADALRASEASRATGSAGADSDGLVIFPVHVFHPGTIANPFMQSAWEDAGPDAQEFIGQVGQRWITTGEQEEE